MELNSLKPFAGSKKGNKRVGRGHGSGHGTYSTRGMKGQNARGGGKAGQKRRGLRMIMLRVPKLRGMRSIHPKALPVNLDMIEKAFAAGEVVTPQVLHDKKLVSLSNSTPAVVKILGRGTLTKQVTFEGCTVSAAARTKIEGAGGVVR